MAYASTAVGPLGLNYIPIDPHEALSRFLQTPLVDNGSDQRSDWMGNVIMLVPLGYLLAGWSAPRSSSRVRSMIGALGALILCFGLILAVKYAQLFFPPRTVTLNYILAQSLGSAIGVLLFGIMRTPLAEFGRGFGRLESLRVILRIYTVLVILFLLMPLDFALNGEDIAAQLARLPETFTAISGEGRPLMIRLLVNGASTLAMIPIGALLTIVDRGQPHVGRSATGATVLGFCLMLVVYALTALLLSGAASLPSVGFRVIGIAAGAWAMHRLARQNADQIRRGLRTLVPWVLPVYLLALVAVNGLLSREWMSLADAVNNLHPRALLPLYNYYIVTKPQAAKNIVAHAIMYAPIGFMIWLRVREGGGKVTAFVLAALLSAMIEAGRALRPGLEPDINTIPLAGIAALVTVMVMPVLWQVLEAVAIDGMTPTPLHPPRPRSGEASAESGAHDAGRRNRRQDRRPGAVGQATGDIEEY